MSLTKLVQALEGLGLDTAAVIDVIGYVGATHLEDEPPSASGTSTAPKMTQAERAKAYRERKASRDSSRAVTRKSDDRHAPSRDGVTVGVTVGVTESDASSHGVTSRAPASELSSPSASPSFTEKAEKRRGERESAGASARDASHAPSRPVTRGVTQPVTRDVTEEGAGVALSRVEEELLQPRGTGLTTTEKRLMVGYQKRYEAAGAGMWAGHAAAMRYIKIAGVWCDAQPDPADACERFLDGAFAKRRAPDTRAQRRWPWDWLVKDPGLTASEAGKRTNTLPNEEYRNIGPEEAAKMLNDVLEGASA